MGAWSHEPFGNDTANDWAYGLDDATDLSLIEDALDQVLETGDEYLDSDLAEEAIAAIEVIAKLLGKGSQSDAYTDKIDAWVQVMDHKPTPALLQKAQRAIDRILAEDSELPELWEDEPEWQESILRLKAMIAD